MLREAFPWSGGSCGHDLVPSFPLSLNQVVGHGMSLSTSAIFRLPEEIIAEILVFVDDEFLSPMALVDRGFRQLARSRQFLRVCFDYSPAKLELLDRLVSEGIMRKENGGKGLSTAPSIGSCVRRFEVTSHHKWFHLVNNVGGHRRLTRRVEAVIPEAEMKRGLTSAKEMYSTKLIALQFVFMNALPHVQSVDVRDKSPWFPSQMAPTWMSFCHPEI